MFEIKALQVAHGDAFIVSYGEDMIRHIMIDGGPASTVENILKVFEDIRTEDRLRIELLVVTHYDLDHIGGILQLLRSPPSWLYIEDIWFNGQHHSCPSDALGIRESDELSEILSIGVTWNNAFHGGPVIADPNHWISLDGGLNILVLSPTKNELEVVGRVWGDYKKISELSHTPADTLGRNDIWPAPNFSNVKRAGLRVDSSAANGSSIALLLEYKKTKVLLAADAFSEVISKSLAALTENPVDIALLKVSHHGSQGNTSAVLLKTIACKKFLISTDGSIHRHPDQALIARILDEVSNPELIFNYNTAHILRWQIPPRGWPRYTCQFPRWDEPFVRISL